MNPRIGTCSWKYDSWMDIVYTKVCRTAAQYLAEYSKKYRTAEIDSWFYRMPSSRSVLEYLDYVDEDFHFTCKLPSAISLTHHRKRAGETGLRSNPDFLSAGLLQEFLKNVEPMAGRIDAMMLEFEYLNREKMGSLDSFLRALEDLLPHVPPGTPLAIETRNKNYLKNEYFEFLKEKGLFHVFSEKLYMPHICEVYEKFGDMLTGRSVVRLLGGDRKAIEKTTGNKWDTIVEPKAELTAIAAMARDMVDRGIELTININNHYEGSAPLTIEKLQELL